MSIGSVTADMLLGGKIRIERVIGEGAMGVVYQAFDTTLARRVAVKVIAPDLVGDQRARQRFEREARSAALLKSEHSVRILDVDASCQEPYLVMEYLEGRSLEAIVLGEGRVAPLAAVDWMLQVLEALAEAHQHGLVHRDIKPANLFLAQREGREPIVKVLDFGLVKDLDPTKPRLTKTGASMGTPAYMSPEQVRAIPDIDTRADIWGVGASLYELLTGNLPFTAKTLPDLLTAIVRRDTAPLLEGRADIPEALEPVVRRCLSKDRRDRYASADELTSALLAAIGGARSTVRLDPHRRGAAGTVPMAIAGSARSHNAPELSAGLAPTQPSAYAPAATPPYAPVPTPAPFTPAPGQAVVFTPPGFAPRYQPVGPPSGTAHRARPPRGRPRSFAGIFVLALLVVVVLGALALLLVLVVAQLTHHRG